MTEINELGYNDTTDDVLIASVDKQSVTCKKMSQNTIINKWYNGALLTDAQLKVIRKDIPNSKNIKTVQVRQAILDKETGEFKGYKLITKHFSKAVKRVNKAIGENLLPDDDVLRANYLEARNTADLELKMFELHHARGNLSGMKAVVADRAAAKKEELMVAKGIQKASFDEIYARAVSDKTLVTVDMTEEVTETTAIDRKEKQDAATDKLLHPEVVVPSILTTF